MSDPTPRQRLLASLRAIWDRGFYRDDAGPWDDEWVDEFLEANPDFRLLEPTEPDYEAAAEQRHRIVNDDLTDEEAERQWNKLNPGPRASYVRDATSVVDAALVGKVVIDE